MSDCPHVSTSPTSHFIFDALGSLGLWVDRRRWVAPYAGSLGSLFEGPLRGEALRRAPLELRNQAVKQAEGEHVVA